VWNPVKELKGVRGAAAGRGARLPRWNPVKELKVGVIRAEHMVDQLVVESGEGIESNLHR